VDRFDAALLEAVLRVCSASRSLWAAGRSASGSCRPGRRPAARRAASLGKPMPRRCTWEGCGAAGARLLRPPSWGRRLARERQDRPRV